MARTSGPRTSLSSAPATSPPAGLRGDPRAWIVSVGGNSFVRTATKTTKGPLLLAFRMRRRGLEPPPTECGPGSQPGNPPSYERRFQDLRAITERPVLGVAAVLFALR